MHTCPTPPAKPALPPAANLAVPETARWPADWASQPWWQALSRQIVQLEQAHLFNKVSPNSRHLLKGETAIPRDLMPGWVADALNALQAQNRTACSSPFPHCFVPQTRLPEGHAYEAFIHATAQVPTRDNWHDLLNGLIWLNFPQSKRQLNRLQAAELTRHGVLNQRGPVRDACTVFDENAALLHAPDAIWDALQARRWQDLFGPLRPLWAQSCLLIFGHAALEKLLTPYKSITAHVWRVDHPFLPSGDLRELDAALAQDLQAEKLAQKPFCPLPVLGVPNWWPANTSPDFYDDPNVFRPLHSKPMVPATRP